MLNLYIAPNGNDALDGRSPDRPFTTLERARDEIRAHPGEAATVFLRGGNYFRETTFTLTAEDSGTTESPVTYRAYPSEEVRLIGGRGIGGFTAPDEATLRRLPEAARAHAVQISLPALGITDYGRYVPRGHGGGSGNAALELFVNRKPMTPARWPNASLPNHGFERVREGRDGKVVYTDDRPRGWAAYDDIYLHGYFSLDWASTIVKVVSLDPDTHEIITDPPGTGHYGVRAGGRFFYFNVLEELDQPGEWHLDRTTGLLTLWSPEPIDESEIMVSLLDGPLIELRDAEHISFIGLTLETMRGDAVNIAGGKNVAVMGCTLRNVGKDGVAIEGGFDHQVISSDICDTGECGVRINAGDRVQLIPCNHRVHNCRLHHIAREGWTYFGAVELRETCGAIVSHNRMHDHRHALMCFRGNDNVIEYNEFYNYTLEGDDCGCMYTGRKFDYQGNVVRCNWIHHAGDSGRNDWGSSGIYMDDGAGGTEIYSNIIHYVNKGVLAGGGVNTRIHDNIFVNCSPAIWFDERCVSARADRGETMVHGWMREQFFNVKADEAPYQVKYPHLDFVLDALRRGTGIPPLGSAVYRNIAVGSRGQWLATHWATYPDYFEFHDNLVDEDPGFVDPAFGLFQLREDSPAYAQIGFGRLPFEEIGLLKDEYRTAIESAFTAIEIVEPVGAEGQPGRAVLRVRNAGDLPVEGVELVELKLQRHGPGVACVEVPYRVAPGEEAAYEFDVALPAEGLQNLYEIFLFSRGERLRPCWTVMPLAYSLESRLELTAPVVAGIDPRPGKVRLTVRNVGKQAVEREVTVQSVPPAAFPNGNSLHCRLAPGEEASVELAVAPEGRVVSRLQLTTSGEGIKPAAAQAIVEYPLVLLPTLPVRALESALSAEPRYLVKASPGREAPAHVADLRLGLAGDCLAISGTVKDPRVAVTEMLWDGSCLEVYGTSPDRERIGHVFGNIPIGQIYLVPACNGEPAKGYSFTDNAPHLAPDIQVHSRPVDGGYAIQALVPLKYLAVNPDAECFLFEVQVTTGFGEGITQHRANLFGSKSAYQDSSRYAMATRRKKTK
ncbi:MAG: right-handed parallel beta-helix repeat-containing protein [Armatimonadota bacterium]